MSPLRCEALYPALLDLFSGNYRTGSHNDDVLPGDSCRSLPPGLHIYLQGQNDHDAYELKTHPDPHRKYAVLLIHVPFFPDNSDP